MFIVYWNRRAIKILVYSVLPTQPMITHHKFKLFIKACHLLALILVQGLFSFYFWFSTIRWLIVERALLFLQEDSFH